MRDVPAENMKQLGESLAAISLLHLTPETQQKLISDTLSVSAYPHGDDGFVYVGSPAYAMPDEADLAEIFAVAVRANILWLKFDIDAGIVDGLPLYGGKGSKDIPS